MKVFRNLVLAVFMAWLFTGHPAPVRQVTPIPHTNQPPLQPRAISTIPASPAPPPAHSNTLAAAPHTLPSPLPPGTPPDPTLHFPVVASFSMPVANATNLVRSVRLVRASFKYPLWRVEEVHSIPPAPDPPRVESRAIAIADHAIVRAKPDLSVRTFRSLCAKHGFTIRKTLRTPGFYLVSAPNPGPNTLLDLLAALNSETASILYAEPDHIMHTTQTFPDDPSFSSLWGLHNTGQSAGTADADVDAPEAWDISVGSPDTIVGVIDSGVDITHPDLAANIWTNPLEILNGLDDDGNGYVDDINGWDFLSEDNTPTDANSHGTHVAGTISAAGNNGIGVAGITWRCKIMPLRFLDAGGSGTTSDAMEALQYATAMRRRGINIRLTSNSWGGGGDFALSDAIKASGEAGMLFVAAAGNSGSNNDIQPFYPASYSWNNIISVAATDRRDALASFSCYGAASVDLAAPGAEIYSTIPGGYGTKNGTSMATPHVAGLAALLWSESPEASLDEVRGILMDTVDPLPALSAKTVTGGRMNAHKALLRLFKIRHTPVGNSVNTGNPYPVTAAIAPSALVDTNQIWLYWNTDSSTNFLQAPMACVEGNTYQGFIPAQPEGATVSYWLKAVSAAGITATHPTNAPAAIHRFTLMPPVTLSVTGSPGTNGPVTPAYGLHRLPSNMNVQASAAWHTTPVEGARWTCLGWTGSGDVPATGASNGIPFTLSQPSAIEWLWSREFALSQTSLVAGIRATTTWWTASATASTFPAADAIGRSNTNYMFAFWLLDGARQPDDTQAAVNPVAGIAMEAPHHAAAVYVPANLDADSDGLPDWWELRFFGSTNALPANDDDADGFSNLDEYRDRTSPRAPDDTPVLPVILHFPLEDPMPYPAPFLVQASVADNFEVAEVALHWSRSGGPGQSAPMTEGLAPGDYQGTLPPPGTNGDVFVYWITASDPLGQTATNGPHTVHIAYPLLHAAPAVMEPVVTPAGATNLPLRLFNLGSAPMEASLSAVHAGCSNAFETGASGWSSTGAGGPWVLDSYRFASPSNAWYCGNPSNRTYSSSMHSCLDSPPIYLGTNATLSFNHWIQSELDTQYWRYSWKPNHAWDGGIVEISTNRGATFFQIAPVGGYSHAISGWSESPWPEDTPCFAGTGGWSRATFDLSPYARRLVILRFHFGTDSNTEEEGWYLDDVHITPGPMDDAWLSWSPTNLVLQPDGAATAAIAFAAGSIPTGDREAAILIACNDPTTPLTVIPQLMRVRSQPILGPLTAAQTSTNGEGWVTLSTTAQDADGEPCAMELEWTTNNLSWTGAWIRIAYTPLGPVHLHTPALPQLMNIPTSEEGALVTNILSATWDTFTNGVGYASATRIRARLLDAWMQSPWKTSQPFVVDNVPPPAVPRCTNTTQTIGIWSTNPAMDLVWRRVTDAGAGLSGYRLRFWCGNPADTVEYETTSTSTRSPPLADSSNWWASVSARDIFGNLGPAVSLGPFLLDSTPPDSGTASIVLDFGPGRTCLLATNRISGSWSGFADAGSGIAGYFCGLSNSPPPTNAVWIPAPPGGLQGVQLDRTNIFHVWARDGVGWISPPAAQPFLALSAGGDWDHDGMPNLAEGTAGTDPASAASLLHLEARPAAEDSIALQWPSLTNRLYTLSWHDTLAPVATNWAAVTNHIRVPGMGGMMTHTDEVRSVPTRFYRLTVEQP